LNPIIELSQVDLEDLGFEWLLSKPREGLAADSCHDGFGGVRLQYRGRIDIKCLDDKAYGVNAAELRVLLILSPTTGL